MRVKLTSVVARSQVEVDLVNETSVLDVLAGLEDLQPRKGAIGDETRSPSRLGTPSDFNRLRVTNGRVGLRRCPETEVWWKSSRQSKQKQVDGTHHQCC